MGNCRTLLILSAVAALMLRPHPAICFTSLDVPAAELPSSGTSPEATTPAHSDESSLSEPKSVPTGAGSTPSASDEVSAPDVSDTEGSRNQSNGSADLENNDAMSTSASETAAEPSPPPPAIDADAVSVGPELGDESLDAEIAKASDPSLAASLRVTEGARKQLVDGQIEEAMRALARAVSLDGSSAFAYYFLGRAYLKKGNYSQALTFFRRAQIGFARRPDWTGETLSYEGICDELLGKPADAAEAYKRALAASPNNLHARVGYGRLASNGGSAVENLDEPPPNQDLAKPPPNAAEESASPEQPPTPAPDE